MPRVQYISLQVKREKQFRRSRANLSNIFYHKEKGHSPTSIHVWYGSLDVSCPSGLLGVFRDPRPGCQVPKFLFVPLPNCQAEPQTPYISKLRQEPAGNKQEKGMRQFQHEARVFNETRYLLTQLFQRRAGSMLSVCAAT